MSNAASGGQALEIVSRFAKINWGVIDGERLQKEVVELTPEEFNRRFELFLQNGARFNFGGMKIALKKFDPAKFIGKKWSVVEEETNHSAESLTEIDFGKVLFETCLKKGEKSLKGEEKLKRLKSSNNRLRLGANSFLGLWEDYRSSKENSVLERLRREQGITYLDFFGTILLDSRGDRYVLYFDWCGIEWHWYCAYLEHDWYACNLSAVLEGSTFLPAGKSEPKNSFGS